MWNNLRVLAIVPARGGSKGIPGKNMKQVNGTSLVGHAGDFISQLDWVDYAFLSTDSVEIRNEGLEHGLKAPALRPAEISGDRSSDLELLIHGIETIESIEGEFDVVLLLQPTCPLRRRDHVENCMRALENADCAWTVSPVDIKYHGDKQLTINADGSMGYFTQQGECIVSRQQLQTTYIRNGACYAWRKRAFMKEQSILLKNSKSVVISDPLTNIDSLEELERTKVLLQAMTRKPDDCNGIYR